MSNPYVSVPALNVETNEEREARIRAAPCERIAAELDRKAAADSAKPNVMTVRLQPYRLGASH